MLARDHTPAFSTHTAMQLDILLVEIAELSSDICIELVVMPQMFFGRMIKLEGRNLIGTETESVMLEKDIVGPSKTFRAISKVQLNL